MEKTIVWHLLNRLSAAESADLGKFAAIGYFGGSADFGVQHLALSLYRVAVDEVFAQNYWKNGK